MELLGNLILIAIVAIPLGILEYLKTKYDWLEDSDGLGFIIWLVMIVLVYFWIAPMMGMAPNETTEPY